MQHPIRYMGSSTSKYLACPKSLHHLIKSYVSAKNGSFGLTLQMLVVEEAMRKPPSDNYDSDSFSVQSESKSSEKEAEEHESVSVAGLDIPDKIKFHLLHSLFSLNLGKNLYNQL
jgi:hypothetical protein